MNDTTNTHAKVYVTIGKNGKPRYSYYSRRASRLIPMTADVAAASFAAGATVYRKQPGVSIWQEQPEVFIG